MTTLAWHNNPTLKTEVMERLRAHRAQRLIHHLATAPIGVPA